MAGGMPGMYAFVAGLMRKVICADVICARNKDTGNRNTRKRSTRSRRKHKELETV